MWPEAAAELAATEQGGAVGSPGVVQPFRGKELDVFDRETRALGTAGS